MRRRALAISMAFLLLAGCRGGENQPARTPIEKVTSADGAKLHLRLDRDKAAVGEAVRLDLTVDGDAERQIEWPPLDETLKAFHVKRLPAADEKSDTASRRQSWLLRPLEAGEVELPAIEVKVASSSTATRQPATSEPAGPIVLKSDPVTLEVAAVAPADANPTSRPAIVDDPRSLPIDRRLKYAIAAAVAIGALAIIALLIVWLRRRQLRPAAPPPPIPADEWALAALRKLRQRGLIDAGRVKEFYFELNMIVRQYIERRFGLRAPEMTTEEFFDSLRQSSRLRNAHQQALSPFMEACDLVKYARHQPTADEIADVDKTAEAFIRRTAHEPSTAHEQLEEVLEEAVP